MALATLIALSGGPVAAHGVCGPRTEVAAQLKMIYGETRQAGRLPGSVMLRELYANPFTRSWSLLEAHPPNLFCFVRFGIGYRSAEPEAPRKGV